MKKYVHYGFSFLLTLLAFTTVIAQTESLTDQNPNYRVSRDHYMKIADSITAWQGTTPQETYKAIDYMADRLEARQQRRAFRQQLRWQRASYYYNDGYYFDDYNYYQPVNSYYPVYSRSYRYGYRGFRNNNLWNALPLAVSLGWWWSR